MLCSLPYREFYGKRQGRARFRHIPHTAPVSTSRCLPCPILVAMAQSCREVAECHLANVWTNSTFLRQYAKTKDYTQLFKLNSKAYQPVKTPHLMYCQPLPLDWLRSLLWTFTSCKQQLPGIPQVLPALLFLSGSQTLACLLIVICIIRTVVKRPSGV